MVGLQWVLGAVADLVTIATAVMAVVAQEIVDLLHAPLPVLGSVDAVFSSDQCQEGGVT